MSVKNESRRGVNPVSPTIPPKITVAMQQMQVRGVVPALHVNELVFRPVFGNLAIILLFLLPMLTMRLFAEERKMRTLELLMTSPITVTEMVLGKYVAATVMRR